MKSVVLLAAALFASLSLASGQVKILTHDPLTGLPLMPPTASEKKLGNAPDKLPDSTVCKSKMQGNFYSLATLSPQDTVKLSDVVGWYGSHLSGFTKVEGSDHAQTVFYNSDRTLLVIVTARSGTDAARTVAYERYQPGLPEKTVVGIPQNKMVCQ
jgi:hypothetical protein